MLGAIYRYFIRFIFINLMFVFSVIGFEYYLNSENLSRYLGIKIIFHLKSLFNDYIINSVFFDLYEYLFFAINIYLLIWLIRYF
jgi:hypothetical protein